MYLKSYKISEAKTHRSKGKSRSPWLSLETSVSMSEQLKELDRAAKI